MSAGQDAAAAFGKLTARLLRSRHGWWSARLRRSQPKVKAAAVTSPLADSGLRSQL
jgi:hypothetical protein